MTRPIYCSSTAHSAVSPGEVLGVVSWEEDQAEPPLEASWGYLCGPCSEAWDAQRAANPDVHPRNLLSLVNPPGPNAVPPAPTTTPASPIAIVGGG